MGIVATGSFPIWLIPLWVVNIVMAFTVSMSSTTDKNASDLLGPVGWFIVALFGIPGYIIYILARRGSFTRETWNEISGKDAQDELQARNEAWWNYTHREPWIPVQEGPRYPVYFVYPPGYPPRDARNNIRTN